MKPAVVRLIDLGLHQDFAATMAFAQSIIQSLTARTNGDAIAEVEFIRTRDAATVTTALQNPAHIIHITAHGASDIDFIGFYSDDDSTELNLSELAESFHDAGEGIEAAVIFADACSTAQGRFTRAIRDCIEQPVIYIGATRAVNWHEATAFASVFYAAYFKDQGRGLTRQARGLRAAERAIKGYTEVVDGRCPFKATELAPSRRALRALGHG